MTVTIYDSETYYDWMKKAKDGHVVIHSLECGQSHRSKKKSKNGRSFLYRIYFTCNQPIDSVQNEP